MAQEEWAEFAEVVQGTICKGVFVGDRARLGYAHLEDMRPTAYLTKCYELAGMDAKFPRPANETDTSDTFAAVLRESGDWEEVVPADGEDFYPLLKDHDLLTWAYSEDGTGGCNGLPGLESGNTTTGFLVKAAGDYPTVWVSSLPSTLSGVHPLADCLSFEKKNGTGLKAKLIYIHRRVE